MRHVRTWLGIVVALVTGAIVVAPGCRSAPEAKSTGSSETVVITGRIELPPLHPMMLFPRRVQGREHIHGGMNQALDERICGYLDKQQPRRTYGLKEQGQLKLGSLLRISAVPWAGSGDATVTEGTVADDGSFRVEVKKSSSGYYLTATGTGGQVKLKARVLPGRLAQGQVFGVVINPITTALSELAEGAGADKRAESDESLKESLGDKLKDAESSLKTRLQYVMMNAMGGLQATKKEPYFTFRPCTAENHDSACYRPGDQIPYALMSASQLPPDAGRWTPGAKTGALGDQYAAQGIRFAAYQKTAATGGTTSSTTTVSEQAAGFILVQPASGAGGVDLVFDQGVRAIGMTIQNGNTHADTARAFPRRGFRFIPMDRYGAPVEEYRWYTNQGTGGAGFYGVASGTPIHRVRVEVRNPGPFTVGDVRFSTTYPQSLAGDLGWVATGNWRLEDGKDENHKFIHPYYTGYAERYGDQDQMMNFREQTADSSRGRYWHVPYGPTATSAGSTLTSPAITLSNLDLPDLAKEGFGWWIIGVTSQTQAVNVSLTGGDGKVYKFKTTGNPVCRIGGIDFLFSNLSFKAPKLMDGCTEKSLEGKYIGGMITHWGHFHFRSNIDVPEKAQTENVTSGPDRTERYIEYSTDNGATWRNLWWWPDQNHHGINGVWWKNHGHGMYDSDMFGDDWNGNGKRGTDFDKDGVDDYVAPIDNNGNGVIDSSPNGDDAREWDTEWYMEYVPPSQWRDVDNDGLLDSDIEGVTARYRLRFVGPSKPASCGTKDCLGWKIDDFAINNDNPRVGYYTSFNGSYDANLR